MKKKYLNLFVCSLLLGGFTTGLVSCKDYDDDITALNTSTDGLSKQLASLQTALQSAQDAATAAQSAADRAMAAAQEAQQAGDAAMAAAQQAEAEAELAKKAAADAKAEAIAAVIEQLKPLIDANESANAENAAAIAALKGRIDGIEQGLANIDLTYINSLLSTQDEVIAGQAQQLQTIETQLKALNQLQKDLNEKLGGVDGIAEKLAKIATLEGELSSLKGRVAANETAINEIKGELTTLSAKISTEVSNAVNTIAGTMSKRLTSVTLMPDVYVDGIPTIEFESAKYVKQVWSQAEGWHDAPIGSVNKRVYIISNNSAQAQYRLNPASIQEEDIQMDKLAYVTRKATTRADETVDDIVKVASNGTKVSDNGILTVKLAKSNTESLNDYNLDANQIYTVSLKVPVAAKHLFKDQGESEAVVYSEFTRLYESYFKPELAFNEDKDGDPLYVTANGSHPKDSLYYCVKGGAGWAANAGINKYVVSNKQFDLYDLVVGCKFYAPDTHKLIGIDDLDAYGMKIKFHMANIVYDPVDDGTNQQTYGKLSGENNHILTPTGTSGDEYNSACQGKQPIIAAMLVDESMGNSNVIEQKYFKICYSAEEMTPVEISWPEITSSGDACNGAEYDFTWSEMAVRVLEFLNDGKGMSEDDFVKIYGAKAPVIKEPNDVNGTLVVDMVDDPNASNPVMKWSLTPAQLVNLSNARKLLVGDNTVVVTKSVTFSDALGLHPDVVINLKWTITVHVDEVTLGETDYYWTDNTTIIRPVSMPIPYDGTSKATYKQNILMGRIQPLVKGLRSCAFFDIDYANKHKVSSVYYGEPLEFQKLTDGSGLFDHWLMTSANQNKLEYVYYSIQNTHAGQQLIAGSKVIQIDWSNDINGFAINRYVFGSMNLQFKPILTLNRILPEGFEDSSVQQSLNIADKYTLTDAYDMLVAKVTPANPNKYEKYAADLYKYYGVEEADFSGEIKVADNADATQNVRTLAQANMSAEVDNATGVLTFKASGQLLKDVYLIVPVKIKHLWGSYDDTMIKGHIAVPVKHVLDGSRR